MATFAPNVAQMCHRRFSHVSRVFDGLNGRKYMAKPRIERSLLFPNKEFRERVRKASKDRGFRSEQAFILAACEREIRRSDDTESVTQFEARIAATLTNLAKQGQHLQTLVEAQVAITDVLLKLRHYLCCGTPRRCAPSGAHSRQVALRQADPRCGERALEQKQRHSEGDGSRWLTNRDCGRGWDSKTGPNGNRVMPLPKKTVSMVLYI